MSQTDRHEQQNQGEFVVVDSSNPRVFYINSDNEIFVCADGVTKIVPEQTGTEVPHPSE